MRLRRLQPRRILFRQLCNKRRRLATMTASRRWLADGSSRRLAYAGQRGSELRTPRAVSYLKLSGGSPSSCMTAPSPRWSQSASEPAKPLPSTQKRSDSRVGPHGGARSGMRPSAPSAAGCSEDGWRAWRRDAPRGLCLERELWAAQHAWSRISGTRQPGSQGSQCLCCGSGRQIGNTSAKQYY